MTVIAYHPPKSRSHGHGPRARTPRKAWSATQDFLREHTTFELQRPLDLTLWASARLFDESTIEAARSKATSMFGPVTTASGEFLKWELPVFRLDEALDFVLDGDHPTDEKAGIGPIDLYVSYLFKWNAMSNPEVLPSEHFTRGNFLGVSISTRRLFIQPTFLFEAPERDWQFIANLQQLEAAMPFVPNDMYYYRIEPKKTGRGEKLVKLHNGWKSVA
jgi:hypothetical protein